MHRFSHGGGAASHEGGEGWKYLTGEVLSLEVIVVSTSVRRAGIVNFMRYTTMAVLVSSGGRSERFNVVVELAALALRRTDVGHAHSGNRKEATMLQGAPILTARASRRSSTMTALARRILIRAIQTTTATVRQRRNVCLPRNQRVTCDSDVTVRTLITALSAAALRYNDFVVPYESPRSPRQVLLSL
ncbi:hypothetical protein BV20DRAFT_425651 [Pilatotrama ljubarskyi]|nr:hypothetical protein BV20DRAFT_425651 [Pilatotrama ljubarskyi]